MVENMFEIRKNETRRKQFIAENSDVAEQILSTNPNINIIQNESIMNVKLIEEDNQIQEEEDKSVIPFNISSLIQEKDNKKPCSFSLEPSLVSIISILSTKMKLNKSIVVSILLKSAILSDEEIQGILKNDKKAQKYLDKITPIKK